MSEKVLTYEKTKTRNLKPNIKDMVNTNTFFLIVAICLLLLVGSIITDSFVSVFNLSRVIRGLCITGHLALGMTFVIVSGGIDLSVGSTFGAAAMIAISLQNREIINTSTAPYPGLDLPLIAILIIGIAAGALIGLANGVGVTKLKIPPFIMTLITMTVIRSFVMVYSAGFQFIGVRPDFQVLGGGMIGQYIPVSMIIFLLLTILCYFTMHRSNYGRQLFAAGANEHAAKISGVRTSRTITTAYIVSGVLAAVGGMLYLSFGAVASPTAGNGYETDAITAVLVGGTSMKGGKGTIAGTALSMLFIGLLNNLLTHMNINSYIQQMITALIIIGVVLIQAHSERKQ